jgi:AraC-like DNA-binding protein
MRNAQDNHRRNGTGGAQIVVDHGDDLTSGALVALMQLSFAEQRLDVSKMLALPKRRRPSPHASLSAKTTLADAILRGNGPVALLRVGDVVPRLASDPLGSALLAARSGRDLMERWLRFERYVHTRHPIAIRLTADTSAKFEHVGTPDSPASDAINFVLAGIFRGLLAAIGCRDIALTIGSGSNRWVVDPTYKSKAPRKLCTMTWTLRWTDPAQDMRPAHADAAPGLNSSERVRRLIEADLLARWTLTKVAARLMLSPRTLQRRLSAHGKSLRMVVLEARIRRATHFLLFSPADLTAISFHCGFADAAHFTRTFKSWVGMTPGEYRHASSGSRKRAGVPAMGFAFRSRM